MLEENSQEEWSRGKSVYFLVWVDLDLDGNLVNCCVC